MGNDASETLQYSGLVDSLQLMYEIDAQLCKGCWTDADCAYYLAERDDQTMRSLLLYIVSTWEKPNSKVPPFFYLNEIVKTMPTYVNWKKFDSYLTKCRYIYSRYSSEDQSSFSRDYPYLKKQIDRIISDEEEQELSEEELQIKYLLNPKDRINWIKARKEQILKENPQMKIGAIASQIYAELLDFFTKYDIAMPIKKSRINRIFNHKK